MKQLWFFLCACAILALGCAEVVPGTCYQNTAGGAGGGGSIPTTSVGATSGTGDFLTDPGKEPLEFDDGDGNVYEFCAVDDPCVCGAHQLKLLSPKAFNFVTTIPEDDPKEPGGWQEASVELQVTFVEPWGVLPRYWPPCPRLTFGMPLRNAKQGKISPTMAARVSARVGNDAAAAVFAANPDIEQGTFCFKWKVELQKRLPEAVFGATVTQR